MRRTVVALCAALAALALAGAAGATSCFVVKKPLSAGEKLFVDLSTSPETVTPTSPAGTHARAGFGTLDFNGDGTGDASVFYFPVTPAHEEEVPGLGTGTEGSHNSGPGPSECDGVGIDDLEACGG